MSFYARTTPVINMADKMVVTIHFPAHRCILLLWCQERMELVTLSIYCIIITGIRRLDFDISCSSVSCDLKRFCRANRSRSGMAMSANLIAPIESPECLQRVHMCLLTCSTTTIVRQYNRFDLILEKINNAFDDTDIRVDSTDIDAPYRTICKVIKKATLNSRE